MTESVTESMMQRLPRKSNSNNAEEVTTGKKGIEMRMRKENENNQVIIAT